jgi:two-component system response regulator YcbB
MEIYIVEDDRTVINILEDIIETNGLGTVCGTSGGQPTDMEEIVRLNPDVVLVDFLMPEKDGIQLVRELKEAGLL